MLFVILIIFILLFVYLSFSYKNKFTWVLSVYILGTGMLAFSVLLYTSKLMNYRAMFNFDHYLYLMLNSIKCNVTDVLRIYNFGVASVMLASMCTTVLVKRRSCKQIIMMLMPIAGYLILADPTIEYSLFLMMSLPQSYDTEFITFLIHAKQLFTNSVFLWYMIMPFFYLYIYYRNTQLRIKKTHAIVSAICIAIIEIFAMVIITISPVIGLFTNIDLHRFSANPGALGYSGAKILISFAVLAIVLFLVNMFRPFSDILKKNRITKNGKILSKNLKLLFHVYKNSFLAVGKLAKQADLYIDKDIAVTRGNLEYIQKKSDEAVVSIGHIIDILVEDNNIVLKKDRRASKCFEIEKCLSAALEKIQMPSNIKLNICYSDDINTVYGEFFHLTEAFVNIIHNAVEAMASVDEPRLDISIRSEEEWVVVDIKDNGYGISKENLKYIFQPLYSTKHSLNNWGVGLAYVRKVVKAHLGYIYVDSCEGEYTKFQILLPHALNSTARINPLSRLKAFIKKVSNRKI